LVPLDISPARFPTAYVSSLSTGERARGASLEHDDHAEISVISEEYLWLLETSVACDETLVGVVPGASVRVTRRGLLKYDLGRAMVVPGARKLLVSAPEVRRAYHLTGSPGPDIHYVHKTTGAELVFRLDRARFGDDYTHLVLEDSEDYCVSNLDFYNPSPLEPVHPRDETRVWPLIHAVERLHWSSNHMGSYDMGTLCSSADYVGDVTPEAINLFVKHRGCSACGKGMMTAHSQLASSRGLSAIAGETAQGDVFFIENGGPKIPVLLIACEASTFIYMHTFEDAAARARGSPRVMVNSSELEAALDGAICLWARAGHPMRSLRFDRESSITSTNIHTWLQFKGVSLDLTAAGQKLGLGEVIGRIVKNRCRATVAGILEKYGYEYPTKWYTRLAADTVCVLNRTVRKGSSLSPSQQFFGPQVKLDPRRDLRAAIGEVLLFKAPKRGVTSDISTSKADWGIVIGRAFNGSGVLEVYCFEHKSYRHCFKFERDVVPAYAMALLH
ncbi:MAG: hypothetical protein WCJ28_06390, partial [Actinomycetota bacterium]